jgi:predicted outer membrane repeat protein
VQLFKNDFTNSLVITKNFTTQVKGDFISVQSSATIKIFKCTFTGGAALNGGAIFVQGEASVYITQSTFSQNVATKLGGAIYGDSMVSFYIGENSEFSNNMCLSNEADALYFSNSIQANITIKDTKFLSRYDESNFINIDYLGMVYIENVIA